MNRRHLAAMIGVALQSLVLGAGLFLAVCKLIAIASDAQVFRYQGF